MPVNWEWIRIAFAAGGSAGGHVAAATELSGNDETNEDNSVSSKPNALVLHNPALGEGSGAISFPPIPTAHRLSGWVYVGLPQFCPAAHWIKQLLTPSRNGLCNG